VASIIGSVPVLEPLQWLADHPAWLVLLWASLTALATGLGALPFFFIKEIPQSWLGHGNIIAAGLMLAASFNLIFEGTALNLEKTGFGVVIGLVAIVASRHMLRGREPSVGDLQGANARKALLIVGVMTAHSFAEGIGVGVSFGEGEDFGSFISLAIAVHNIPEGLAISLVLVPRGTSASAAGSWSIFSSLPQPLMAVPAFLFVLAFQPWLPFGLGFAAGAMIWMVFSELLPEALGQVRPGQAGITATLAILAMMLFQALLGG
jgi:zinc transporter ZupT